MSRDSLLSLMSDSSFVLSRLALMTFWIAASRRRLGSPFSESGSKPCLFAKLANGNNEINRIDEMAKRQGLNPDSLTGESKNRREAAIQNVIKANRDKSKKEKDDEKTDDGPDPEEAKLSFHYQYNRANIQLTFVEGNRDEEPVNKLEPANVEEQDTDQAEPADAARREAAAARLRLQQPE